MIPNDITHLASAQLDYALAQLVSSLEGLDLAPWLVVAMAIGLLALWAARRGRGTPTSVTCPRDGTRAQVELPVLQGDRSPSDVVYCSRWYGSAVCNRACLASVPRAGSATHASKFLSAGTLLLACTACDSQTPQKEADAQRTSEPITATSASAPPTATVSAPKQESAAPAPSGTEEPVIGTRRRPGRVK
jgi:hypothetical protein